MWRIKIKFIVLTALFAIFMLAVPAFAEEATGVDTSRVGSFSVTLDIDGAPLSNVKVTVYKLADFVVSGNETSFVLKDEFKDCGVTIDEILADDDVLDLLPEYIADTKISGTSGSTNDEGFIKFTNLSLGLYLVVPDKSSGEVANCQPFCVSVPIKNNGTWTYDIDATPKADVVKLIDLTVKKVWNDGNAKERPDSVNVELLKDGKVIDTVTISAEDDWRYVWTDVEKSDTYSVKEIDIQNGYVATYSKQGSYNFTIINSTNLAKTGQLNWPIPVLAISGIVLFLIGWAMFFLKKENENA